MSAVSGSMVHMQAVIGFDPTTLRPTVDDAVATARIDAIGLSRSLVDLEERARLLLAVGRLDEAQGSAARALMVARATGDRAESARLRLLRAAIALAQGRTADAARDCDSVAEESAAAGWHRVHADALHERGVVHFATGAWQPAADAFAAATSVLRAIDAGQEAIEHSEVAALVALDRADRAAVTMRRGRPHPLFGAR